MFTILNAVSVAAFIAIIAGLIRPKTVIPWMKKQTRLRVLLFYGLVFIAVSASATAARFSAMTPEEYRQYQEQEAKDKAEESAKDKIAAAKKSAMKKAEEAERQGRLLKREAYDMAQVFVKRRLKTPATADFPSYINVKVYNINNQKYYYGVRGYVDAQNQFGATVRHQYVCEMKYKGNGEWRVTNLVFTQ